MPSEPFTLEGLCGVELYGKTWFAGTNVTCDRIDVKGKFTPRLEPQYLRMYFCGFCNRKDSKV